MNIDDMKAGELKQLISMLSEGNQAQTEDGRYVIVRTYSAGVFAGEIQSKRGKEVVLHNARRIWYWDGAASLSQLAQEGTNKPGSCKFPVAVNRIELMEVVEILDCTNIAKKSIEAVKVWQE